MNNLSGGIPMSIFNLSSLDTLQLNFNKFEGVLPSNKGFNLPSIKFFLLVGNELTGNLPASLLNSTSLMEFGIDANNFTGEVPAFGSQKNLYWLGLSQNHFGNGMLDDMNFMYSLQNCTGLEQLILENNNLGGVLPKYIGNMSNLLRFSIGGNLIRGNIPTEISQLENLQVLSLKRNNFTGMIPKSIGQLRQLSMLHLHHNKFSGEIPHSLGNLTRLIELNLGSNNLQGTVPSSLGSCKFLSHLYLNGNHLGGPIPKEMFKLSLIEFDLSSNHLTGYFPVEIDAGNLNGLRNLIYMNLSYNNLSGEIPRSFGTLTTLTELYLGNNALQGAIPSSLSSLRSLEYVDLSHNHFVGKIPNFLDEFVSLKFLNLSYNDLEGEVPLKGVFRNMSAVSIVGNTELCGGIPEFKMPKCSDKLVSRRRRLSHRLIIVMLIIGGLLAATTGGLVLFWCAKRKKRSTSSENSSLDMIPRVTYNTLHKATNGFSISNMIGSGTFSSVYKGILEENGKFVAIKVLKLQVRGASKSFLTECEALKHIKHRNLVKLLTSCSSIDHQGNDFKALIYEFMANGNLSNWLHQKDTDGEENHEPKTLNTLQRLNVVIDVASALDYLHHQSGTPLTHRDIKPNNVLLDEDFVAHLGDFGLAKFLPDAAHLLSLSQSSSLNISGTIGYVPPEYATGNTFSTYGDVYSYGILLLETFTGRSPTDDIFKDGLNLHDFVKRAVPEQVKDVSDPILVYDERGRLISTNKTIECLSLIFRIGIACSVESAKDRMDIADVVNELSVIKDDLLRN
ncbi:probable LRR receptor-like serine/threonine-protein kinase At3g47570 isoform X2 [Lycium ferocissimum]|nr:probable LRR receptor-like serine/threonine-protein kinase At3g47570 isoform X2 [Lycium ferocissimum]